MNILQQLLQRHRNLELIKLNEVYSIEKKAERIIRNFWNDLLKSNVKASNFFNANNSKSFSSKYLNRAEQLDCIITSDRVGRFCDKKGNLLNGKYIYVVDKDSEIIALPYQKNMHHSFLANGKKIQGAGFMFFEEGMLKVIDNNSGHYRPTIEQMKGLLSAICQIVPNQVKFVDYSNVDDKFLYEYNLKDLIYALEKGETYENLKYIADSKPYAVLKFPNIKTMENRLKLVKVLNRELRENLDYHIEHQGVDCNYSYVKIDSSDETHQVGSDISTDDFTTNNDQDDNQTKIRF
ncbi:MULTISPECIES: hypothetical protein [Legionella]|uniref:hypothetical protein n=1 Tax=Legionella TaxID=445 RepID=UPI00104150FE|nr:MULTISPECIES: hypothetical protein [Legionella]